MNKQYLKENWFTLIFIYSFLILVGITAASFLLEGQPFKIVPEKLSTLLAGIVFGASLIYAWILEYMSD